MSWLAIGDWAEEMDAKMRALRRERLKLAAAHFGMDVLDVMGDRELEDRLLARYQATGQPWPELEEDEE